MPVSPLTSGAMSKGALVIVGMKSAEQVSYPPPKSIKGVGTMHGFAACQVQTPPFRHSREPNGPVDHSPHNLTGFVLSNWTRVDLIRRDVR